jgi:LysR family transcriptional regulator, transcriptional activator of the cysJI operon
VLHIFKSFCLVVETRSLSKAAKLLHLSQPAIGAQMQTLEREYDAKLLNRSNQGVELTEVGKIVYDYARQLLHVHEEMELAISKSQNTNSKSFRIGADAIIGSYAIPYIISSFKTKYATTEVKMSIMENKRILKEIANKEIDLGILDGPSQCSSMSSILQCMEISKDPIQLVTSSHIRPKKKELTLDEFLRLPIILPSKELKIREVIDASLQLQLGIQSRELNVVSELNSISAIKSSVISGYGASFFSNISIHRDLDGNELKIYNIAGLNMEMSYYLVYHSQHENRNVDRFISFLRKNPIFMGTVITCCRS